MEIKEEIRKNFQPKTPEEGSIQGEKKGSRVASKGVISSILPQNDDEEADKDTIKYDNSPIRSTDSSHKKDLKKLAITKKQDRMDRVGDAGAVGGKGQNGEKSRAQIT